MKMKWLNTLFVSCLMVMATQNVAVASDASGVRRVGPSDTARSPQRVVSLGGTVTEIVYELGKEDVLVGNDLSSIYPPEATALPRVGYYRSLPLEGLLSLNPDLILASEQAGPPDVLERLQKLGIPVTTISDDGTLDSLSERILQISLALHVQERGAEMEQRVRAHVDEAISQAQKKNRSGPPVRTIMLMKRSSNQMQAAGSGTTAATLLELAGLNNVVSTQRGYKTLSPESLAALQPDLIITTLSSIAALGGKQAFSQTAGVNLTPAAQNGNILVVDDLLILGLGPRTAQTIDLLTSARLQIKHLQ